MCECLTCMYPIPEYPACVCRRFRFRSSQSSRSRCGRGAGAGVVALAPLHSDTRHQPPAPFSCSDLARRFASPTVKPSISFFPRSIPPHPPLSSAQIITSPLPHLRPPTSPSAFDFDLSSPAESSHVHLRPTSTTAKLTFVSSKSGIPVLASNPSSSSSFFVLRLVQSFSSQERVNEATAVGRKQPKANCTPPPKSSRVQPSPAQRLHPLLTAPPSRYSPLALVGTHFLHPTTTRSVASSKQQDTWDSKQPRLVCKSTRLSPNPQSFLTSPLCRKQPCIEFLCPLSFALHVLDLRATAS
ncbi:hypothetical protein FJTKL_11771 [Diaporthe vaccinii]|uniref:Uncharacterized protein n=1 Tax=Diaporthe vaccinii TaxID=105482 RepID=A0ABR4EF51_9PEZI